jgi:transposase-like protein
MARRHKAEACVEGVDPYEGMRTRAHWKAADAARVLADWSESGESLAAFARRHELGLERLSRWRERLAKARAPGAEGAGARLIPMVVRPSPLFAVEAGAKSYALSIVVDGTRIEVADVHGADPRWVAALVHELRGGRA